jgi:hypothetical protein
MEDLEKQKYRSQLLALTTSLENATERYKDAEFLDFEVEKGDLL